MRIAVYHNQPSGGARRALSGFGRELARRHVVDVFTLTTADQELIRDEDWASSVTRFDFKPRRAVRMGLFLNDLLLNQSLEDLERINALIACRIDASDYDVVLVDVCRFTYAPALLAHVRTPALYYCHHGPWRMDDVPTGPARSAYEEARRIVHAPFENKRAERIRSTDRGLVRQARAVLVNSRYTAERVWREYEVEAELCPPGVDVPHHPSDPPDTGHVLTVGTLEPHKGHELVVHAIALLPRERRPHLHIVANDGSPAYRRRIESLAATLGVRLSIGFRVSEANLDAEYASARLFVYGARREPLGLAPLEAMAHGVPVVGFYEGGVPETVLDGKTGFLTRADPGALAARVEQLLSEPILRQSMGAAARREVAERWAWPARAAHMEELLRSAAALPVAASR